MFFVIFGLIVKLNDSLINQHTALDVINTAFAAIRPTRDIITCSPDANFNMRMFTYNGFYILRSQLDANNYVDISVKSSGIQYNYVSNDITVKHGYLVQF